MFDCNSLPPQRQRQLQKLLKRLGLPKDTDVDWSLLDLALTHPSFDAESNYDRLEFVGDAVVRMVVAEFLWETYPEAPVGEFSSLRSELVSDRTLAKIAENYSFDRFLLVSSSAVGDKTGYTRRMADAMEAVLAALYLSKRSLELIRPWLDGHLLRLTKEIRADPARKNYKAALQEWTQAHYKALPEYHIKESRPIHGDPHRFTAEVWLHGHCLGQGQGRSIKAAEQAAAQEAFLARQSS
jgi:ribonuclease-3